ANTLNRLDMERRERGYYETLTRSSRQELVDDSQVEDLGWVGLRETPVVMRTEDIRTVTLAPSAEITLKGAHLRTNQWGMRDREYTKAKPEGTYRLALLGSSHVMGLGVEEEETFDNQLEARLDVESFSPGNEAYQVLNFAVGGYGLLQMVYVAKHMTPQFGPDVVLYFIHPGEVNRMIDRLRAAMVDGAKLDQDFSYISNLLKMANAEAELPPDEFRRRLLPYSDQMLNWSLRELASAIRDQNAIPVFVFLAFTRKNFEADELGQLSEVSNDVGAIPILLTEVYEDYEPDHLVISAWDDHPNALGHRLVADALLRELKSTTWLLAPNGKRPQ
ncbi:MAG TPA: SGNH/GDSL hydrolase family protein, partial [Gemmatimonadota bacterium]|nr:SGNH/GDSL hydrolase family protein [Gemmatimonadota bacterium]